MAPMKFYRSSIIPQINLLVFQGSGNTELRKELIASVSAVHRRLRDRSRARCQKTRQSSNGSSNSLHLEGDGRGSDLSA